MKKMFKVFVLVTALSLAIAPKVYAMNDGFVGAVLSGVKEELEASNSEFEIVYKYESHQELANDIIVSQSYTNGIMTVVVNNTSNVGIEYDEVQVKDTNSFKTGACDIVIDGNYSDWQNLPVSYEYNWDNSENCWYNGEWKDDICYKTPVNTYDTNVRHGMQMCCDGQYVYVHITFARIYKDSFNNADYRFYVDGEEAAFSFDKMDGTPLYNVSEIAPGTYQMMIRHRDSANSYLEALGAKAFLTVYENKECSDLEFRIPLVAMQEQNKNISLNSVGTIELFNPNLMYRRIICAGTGTGPLVSACIAVIMVGSGCMAGKAFRKNNKEQKEEKE